MLGRRIADAEVGPRRWLQRLWGVPDIHARQKWSAVWPELEPLPHEDVRLIDAGCGSGAWSLEIASRRPAWTVAGVDRNVEAIARAEALRARLGLGNVTFESTDFVDFRPKAPVDVVLSVASAHYLTEAGRGDELFSRFRSWLKPRGVLVLFGPRRTDEVPFVSWLPRRDERREAFSAGQLEALCRSAGLTVEKLTGRLGAAGTAAKQVDWARHGLPRPLSAAIYPLGWALSALDARGDVGRGRSMGWLLRASASAA